VENGYAGTVTEVTKNSITIQWVNSPGEKPKTFAVSETLAAGKPGIEPRVPPGWVRNPTNPMPVMPQYMYRLLDVKVGDCVGIFYARINGVDICDHICIGRRPGGLVPPLPKEAEDLRDIHRKARERYKAQYPNLPESDQLLKALKPPAPYHERMNAYWDHLAPMPHLVDRNATIAP
jgi:hypothetical protein